ncbi:hypothetical protein XI09_12275 [Bradyrhizobium sp. CCBAU 11386]|nr:hypothetical protein [Bradyrhizobium sp. CCBAU 11386]
MTAVEIAFGAIALDCSDRARVSGVRVALRGLLDGEGNSLSSVVATGRGGSSVMWLMIPGLDPTLAGYPHDLPTIGGRMRSPLPSRHADL